MQKGSLVECINDEFEERAFRLALFLPVKGQLYVVRKLILDDFSRDNQPGVLLEEIVNPLKWFTISGTKYLLEPRFYSYRFREVQPPVNVMSLVKIEQLEFQ